MNKTLILMALALTACTAKAPLSLEVVRSEMSRCPEASYIDGLEGKLKWNYTTGLELQAFLDLAIKESQTIFTEGRTPQTPLVADAPYFSSNQCAMPDATGAEVASDGIGPYELTAEGTSAQPEPTPSSS